MVKYKVRSGNKAPVPGDIVTVTGWSYIPAPESAFALGREVGTMVLFLGTVDHKSIVFSTKLGILFLLNSDFRVISDE